MDKRAEQINALSEQAFSPGIFKKMVKERIEKANIEAVKNDVYPFLKNPEEMEIWSTMYFMQLADMMLY